jgi:hypothetical protein
MNTRFLRPSVVWSGVWIAFSVLIFSIAYWQSKLYCKDSIERVQKQEFKMLHSILPYAVAFLEEHGQTRQIRGALQPDQDLFTVVYTDLAGAIKYPPPSADSPAVKITSLRNYKFSYVYKSPLAWRGSNASPAAGDDSGAALDPQKEAYGKLYLIAKAPPSLTETIWDKNFFQKAWTGESFLGFTIIGYFLVVVGFTAICSITAKFQSHFQSALEEQHNAELETRDLRIQILESNLKTLDLRLDLLNQEHEKALSSSTRAKKAIDRLVQKLQSESTKNEELENRLGKAQMEHKIALQAIQSINADIEIVAAEKRQLETMRQAEQVEDHYQHSSRRPKEYLWLNLVYKNLLFSRRALQNIIELQNVHDVFPSLPDALAVINQSTVEALLARKGIPSRSVVRYTQPVDHVTGSLWEYRFSKDGRIFFGISQSRTWNIDTVLLKRRFSHNRYKYKRFLENTLGKDNHDLTGFSSQ